MQLKSSIKILVVDEFTASRKALVYTLEQLGYENMEEVPDGYSALVRLKSALFDLVITDWEMSKMRGLQLLREIRADQMLKHIPVLMVTEDTNLENIVDAVKAGLNAYVIKPVDVTSFSVKMKNIFK